MGEKKIEWIDLNEAERLVSPYFKRATIYQYISKGRIERKGPFHHAFVRKDQLLKAFKLDGIVNA